MKDVHKKQITRIFKYIVLAIGIPAVLFILLALFLTVTEFRPEPLMKVVIHETEKAQTVPDAAKPLRIVTWNIGYGGLGAKQDFFMDGGSMVRPESKAAVSENLAGCVSVLKNVNADIWMIQEIDEKAKRSYYINQRQLFAEESGYGYAAAYNFKCRFVPYPVPFIGSVASGLASFSSYPMTEAVRVSLPVPFSWPVRLANLKRCLLVTRIPLSSGKTAVFVNVHLEAFDNGEAKIEQTKVLMEFLTAEYKKGNFVIAGGDFNQTFPHSKTDRYPQQKGFWQPGTLSHNMLPENWHYAFGSDSPTCRSTRFVYEKVLEDETLKNNWQYYLIDGFIVSPNVKVQSVKTVDASFLYSDHNPVIIEIMLDD